MTKLGLGLIGIGRAWGHENAVIPSEKKAIDLLSFAHKLGISYFDTAPSYGLSEKRLGMFLATLGSTEQKKLIIATKFGEHWDRQKKVAYTDQSFSALKKSLDSSLLVLKKIDILYLHKASLAALKSKDVLKGFEYAKSIGIKNFGASVSDIDAAHFVCNNNLYTYIQFPYNLANQKFAKTIDFAIKKNKTIVINRPFGMGDLLFSEEYKNIRKDMLKEKAYKFILEKDFKGYILTGTKDKKHLEENFNLFSKLNSR